MLTGGSVPGLLTANFGSGAREGFAVLRRHQPKGPLMCMETVKVPWSYADASVRSMLLGGAGRP
ncbi:hypothetical protein SBADM41S_10796 [Streptomyces badius]